MTIKKFLPMSLGAFALALSLTLIPGVAEASFVEMPSISTIITSTTDWSSPLFLESSKFLYVGLGVTVALAVILLIRRSVSRLVRGATGSRGRRMMRRRR